VACGAQCLINDYYFGLMVPFDEQCLICDGAKTGETTGQVDGIALQACEHCCALPLTPTLF